MTTPSDSASTRDAPEDADMGLIEITRRCESHGIGYDWRPRANGPTLLALFLPNGRQSRRVLVIASEAEAVLNSNFESLSFLGDYDGFCNRSTGEIEVNFSSGHREFISTLPGAVEIESEDGGDRGPYPRKMYRFTIEHNGIEIEISPPSEMFDVTSAFVTYTLKIRGAECGTQEIEIAQLERYAQSLFFSFEVNLDVGCRLEQVATPRPRTSATRDAASIAFPRTDYPKEPLSLFLYGRSVPQLPLLEYLSYYQVLEYFFPLYSKREAISRIRNELLSPSFSTSSDTSISRLISASAPSIQTTSGEKDQLKLTVRGVITDSDIRDYLSSDAQVSDHFKKGQVLRDCPKIFADASRGNLSDQVAERIYDIRCRIVHTKLDGGDGRGLLVATSPEVKLLHRDIELVRMIARKAVIASGSVS